MTRPVPDPLISIAENSLGYWASKLNNTQYRGSKKPTLSLTQRGRIAGAAVLQKNIIRLQPKLFALNQTYFTDEVIPHELAHIVVYQYYGKVKPHGEQWQYMMREVFGLEPKVRHSLDVKAAGIKMFDYKCACDTVQLSAVRHNRIVRGQQQYFCRSCKALLVEHPAENTSKA